jgi:hypothetical protein
MRVAVIRGDISKALFIADVESKSQASATTEPSRGNSRYVGRPNATNIQNYLNAQGLVTVAATLITATVPVGGPVDVSSATIMGVAGLGAATAAQVAAIQELLAPQFVETDAVKKSFLSGNLSGYRSASFNPDPRRDPALTPGAAIALVQDDGVTPFTFAGPVITTADKDTPGAGDLRITGTDLGPYGLYTFAVILTGTGTTTVVNGGKPKRLTQAQIVQGGGSINSAGTIINIPAALVPGIALTTTFARVQVNDMLSAAVALT